MQNPSFRALKCFRSILLLVPALLVGTQTGTSQTITNPLFPSQDPYVTFWNGNYYYTQASGHNGIQIIKSATLTGLKAEVPLTVWNSPWIGPDGHANIWAPEIHLIDEQWYIYFAADFKSNGRHRIYVLQGGSDPLDPYVVAQTGAENGQIVESTGKWAIDPNVFVGADNQLYMTWSCTNNDIGTPPQNLCITRMKDALHTAAATVQISAPTESWETRTGPIEEGPIGFVHNGSTYLTFSASASWTPNDYSVGVLINASGDMLDPKAWVKKGPIFDHHDKAYGPGSVVFVPSADGTELWTLYHAYDQLTCAAWACRTIRAQKISWDANGIPLLGYPINPGVKTWVPSGDMGSRTGWGDSHSGVAASTSWTYNSAENVDGAAGGGALGAMQTTFRGQQNPVAFSVSTNLQLNAGSVGQFGVFATYLDDANHVEAYVDTQMGLFVTTATMGGTDQERRQSALPTNFDATVSHTIRIDKSAANLFIFALDGAEADRRTFNIEVGQVGLMASAAGAHFRGIALEDNSFGWGDAYGDSAEGLTRDVSSLQSSGGYVHGKWAIQDGANVESSSVGRSWNTLYQGNPNFIDYTAQVDAQLVNAGTGPSSPRFGLIACHDDRNNELTVWVDAAQGVITWNSMIQGQSSWAMAGLPAGFDATQFHTLTVKKAGTLFSFLLDGALITQGTFALANGTAGVVSQNADAIFRNFSVIDR